MGKAIVIDCDVCIPPAAVGEYTERCPPALFYKVLTFGGAS
ncbi:hypothetical protein RMSM_03918 [Rhodopirellula maiorica SM1]|uniref:Uncharacterized protein n=1 Tax=Rhodopirellula maiorica SM1 TaxID=1265738 RepID=M5RIW6_9BACT|nr:hypothetical protein RMSM_03918 [Rhodopirellula maiorica SM1]